MGPVQLWGSGMLLTALDIQRAKRRPYTPPERLSELIAAPFQPRVLRRPEIWAGGTVLLGGAIALSFGLDPQAFDLGAAERLRSHAAARDRLPDRGGR